MKKCFYLCTLMLLSLNTMAQIDPYDNNWEVVINDDFSGNRYWDGHWDDATGIIGYKPLWRCFSYNLWNSGVTKYDKDYPNYAAYQASNAVFGTDNTLKLVGAFKTSKNMTCYQPQYTDTTYFPAPWHKYCHYCDNSPNLNLKIHYSSGMIESTDSLGYGYYEIKSKMPIHRGSFDSFWFWGDYGKYEEIDVFEHGVSVCENDTARGISSGIFYNPDGPNYDPIIDSITGEELAHGAYKYARCLFHVPVDFTALDKYHTYGCLWLPEKVVWYFDGKQYNEETDPSHIPQHPMWLKIIHYEDRASNFGTNDNPIWWQGTDEMTIDYVKYYRLKTSCDIDTVLRTLSDFQNYYYSVKHSITIGGQNNSTLSIPNNLKFTMRAVDSIVIDGSFEVPQGTEMTLIIQNCPECSQEGVHSQNYCPY